MGYRVDYTLLDAMYEQLNNQVEAWDSELNAAKTAVERLIATSNMSGVGADAIRNYLKNVHAPLVESLIALVDLHRTNCLLYKTDYQQSIDTGFDTVIDEEELSGIVQALGVMKNAAIEVDDEVRAILRQINDIFVTSFRSVTDVADALGVASGMCSTLSQNIIALESRHSQYSFTNTASAIDILTNTINTYLNQGRSFKANYDPNSSANANSNYQLTMLSSILVSDLNGKAEAAQTAVEYHESRKEMENRIETAKWQKLLVSALVVVGSAVLIAALPVSGPLVVGLVSGASSAIIGATNEAADLYIEDGSVSGDDWNKVIMEGSKGFVTGMVTGVVGGIAGRTISDLTKGIPALQSANAAVNVTTHVVIGSTSEVVSGVATRTASEIVDQVMDEDKGLNTDIDWKKVKEEALDPTEIGKDIVIGGAGGYMDGHKVDYSEGMNSDYEKGVINEMYESGELEYTVDQDLDAVEVSDKDFIDHLSDYTIKHKDTDGSLVEEILSPDDYSHQKYEDIMIVNKVIDKTDAIIIDDIHKSHDEIIQDVQSED